MKGTDGQGGARADERGPNTTGSPRPVVETFARQVSWLTAWNLGAPDPSPSRPTGQWHFEESRPFTVAGAARA
ncbi:hypothetical protein OH686_05055 [Pseudomonas sp. SO81]|nr:hypothetical protein OH686_05055 [Pseudomonas sp. SO81]